MGILTYLIDAQIDSARQEIDGKTLTRPMLLLSDGTYSTYAVDVDVGEKTPLYNVPIATGAKDARFADVGSAVRLRRSESGWFEVTGLSKRMPGTYTAVPVSIPKFTFAPQVVYNAATPPAATGGVVVGTPAPVGITSRAITYGELATLGGYGLVPYGAIAFYSGGVLTGVDGNTPIV